MKFEYWVEHTDDEDYPWTLMCAVVGKPESFIGYQLSQQTKRRLETDYMTLDYLLYRLTDNLKQINENKENAK